MHLPGPAKSKSGDACLPVMILQKSGSEKTETLTRGRCAHMIASEEMEVRMSSIAKSVCTSLRGAAELVL